MFFSSESGVLGAEPVDAFNGECFDKGDDLEPREDFDSFLSSCLEAADFEEV